ncbi:MAG: hypothetical protein ACR2JQ_12935 [Mycobacteriales bacterium]
MEPAAPLVIDRFDYEVDTYSIVGGEYTDNLDVAGGSAVLHAHVGSVATVVSISAASILQALGHAVVVLMRERPGPGVGRLAITGYVDSETGELATVDRAETPAGG